MVKERIGSVTSFKKIIINTLHPSTIEDITVLDELNKNLARAENWNIEIIA